MVESFLKDRVYLYSGDCLERLVELPENSIDSCVCDPPYHLQSIVKRFANSPRSEATENLDVPFGRHAAGFMGKQWDGGDVAFRPETWAAVLRVLKPGAWLVAMSGTRTYHRMACAIEDAGFVIYDQIAWCYGSGFPKSHDISKAIDRTLGAMREVVGEIVRGDVEAAKTAGITMAAAHANRNNKAIFGYGIEQITEPATDEAREWDGWGTALKPSHEDMVLARKPWRDADYCNMIGSTLACLWSRLWSMLSAKAAAEFSALSPSACGIDAHAFAQWSADDKSNTRAALSARMDMSQFESALISSLSTVSLWNGIWAEASRPENTSIIETELSTTIGLRILRSCLLKITPATIIQAHARGQWSNADASNAENIFNAAISKLNATLELFVRAHAIAQEQTDCQDGDAPKFNVGWTPICLARKPLSEGTIAANVLRWGTGGLNIDGCRVVTDDIWNPSTRQPSDSIGTFKTGERTTEQHNGGRWPANLVHDGSAEVVAAFPDAGGGYGSSGGDPDGHGIYGGGFPRGDMREVGYGDSGSAARFFYQAKPDFLCDLCNLPYNDVCDANNAVNASPTESTLVGDSAHSDVPDLLPLERVGKDHRSRVHAIGAENNSLQCPPQGDNIAPSNAAIWDESRIVQNVRSAANLCSLCATDIARALVAVRTARNAASVQFKDFIVGRNAPILIHHLALYVAGRESTDTILTMENLKQLFGSVFHVIEKSMVGSESGQGIQCERLNRLFYGSKADQDDRLGARHPTVKPLDLMQWLVRLVTPPKGITLDPFAGTGTTGEAAYREGMSAVLIERETEYQADIRRRMALALSGPDERSRETIKAKGQVESPGPLFDALG